MTAFRHVMFRSHQHRGRCLPNSGAAMLRMLGILASILGVSFSSEFYVSPSGSDGNPGTEQEPFQSIAMARNAAKAISANMTSDITIHLRSGTYALSAPLTFDATHSGMNGHFIVYQSFIGESATLIGGTHVTGWTIHDAARNIYRTTVGTTHDTRQLYVNGIRCVRARSTDASGWTESGNGYTCPVDVAGWGNITSIEVVSRKEWKCHRGPIASITGTHAVMAQPYWNDLHNQYDAPPAWVENAYELLDSPGEWYLDRITGVLYYKPRQGEDMATANVAMPILERLIDATGVSHVKFKNLTFSYATWLTPNSISGHAVEQADNVNSGQMPGNIHFDACDQIHMESCRIMHMGGTALRFVRGSDGNLIYNNEITDISGSGISIGSFTGDSVDTKDNMIDNNLVSHCGLEYEGSVGILIGYSQRTRITHNELIELPYSGISVGWGWDKTKEAAKDCDIGYNKIGNYLLVLRDGAGIYTLSNQPGSRFHHNYMYNAVNDYGGMYPDEGSSNSLWDYNVVDGQTNKNWMFIWTSTITNIMVQNNYSTCTLQRNDGTNCIFTNNSIVNGVNWPPEALAIITGSGRLPVNSIPAIDAPAQAVPSTMVIP